MINKYPLVSTYILCYQNFKNIYECINSVLSQDYPSIQLIISDDFSDMFPRVDIIDYINSYKRDNIIEIKVIQNTSNLGTVKHINKVLKMCSGDYIIGISCDDIFYDDNVYKRLVNKFIDTGSFILCCRRLLCKNENLEPKRYMPNDIYINKINKYNTPEKQFKAFALNKYYEMASGSSLYFNNSLLKQYGYFREEYILWEDGPFFVDYTFNGNFINFSYDITTTKYREGGISGQRNPLLIKDHKKYLLDIYDNKSSNFNFLEKRKIKFMILRLDKFDKYNLLAKILLCLSYVDVVFDLFLNKYFCKYSCWRTKLR